MQGQVFPLPKGPLPSNAAIRLESYKDAANVPFWLHILLLVLYYQSEE